MSYFVENAKCKECTVIRKYDFQNAVRIRLKNGEEIVTTPDRLRGELFSVERQCRAKQEYDASLKVFAEVANTFKPPVDWGALANRFGTSKIGAISKYLAARRRNMITTDQWESI